MAAQFDSESIIQLETQNALRDWMKYQGHCLTYLPPNSTQGEAYNEYAGDLIAVLQDCHLLILEFKAKHPHTDRLQRYDPDQYAANRRLWDQGVPIRYAYSREPFVTHWNQPGYGEVWLLDAISQSPPHTLGNEGQSPRYADVARHQTLHRHLLDLLHSDGSTSLVRFAQACGVAMAAHHLRNGVVLLLFSKARKVAHVLSGPELARFYRWVLLQKRGLSLEAYDDQARIMAATFNTLAEKMEAGFRAYHEALTPPRVAEATQDPIEADGDEVEEELDEPAPSSGPSPF